MQAPAFLKSVVRATQQDRRGVAAVEFALIAPVVVTLLLGVYGIGSMVHQQLLLQQALRAGGLYALSFPTQLGADTSPSTPNNGILLAIQQALPAAWTDVLLSPPEVSNGPCHPGADPPSPCNYVPPPSAPPYFSGAQPYSIKLAASRENAGVLGNALRALGLNSISNASYVIRVQ